MDEIDEAEPIEEIEELDEIAEVQAGAAVPARKGLLSRAIGKAKGKGLLAKAAEKASAPARKGLLAKASSLSAPKKGRGDEAAEQPQTSRGFMAMASEIEFSQKYPVETADEELEIVFDIDIESPFASMFHDLETISSMASD